MLAARVGVKDLEREIRFYEALGFEIERREGGAVVRLENVSLTLEPFDDLRTSDAPLLEWNRTPSELGAGVQFYILVSDVDAFSAGIKVGVPRPWPVHDKPWGYRELSLRTPSGYLLTFAQSTR
jgi:catechol 2,3-dioxygenase-like lactoylglutathione lyase family enzyme